MGCGNSSDAQYQVDSKEDKEYELEKAKADKCLKVLCLGAGESGKSTFVKQLTFLYSDGLSASDIEEYRTVLLDNAIQCISHLVTLRRKYVQGDELPPEQKAAIFEYAADKKEEMEKKENACLCFHESKNYSEEDMQLCQDIWRSAPIQKVWEQRVHYWHLESTAYFLTNCKRWVKGKPTEEDIINARRVTTGVIEKKCDIQSDTLNDTITWRIVDVGGQRSERKKWTSCFHDIHAVFYLVNLSGYCKQLYEARDKTRMQESIDLFKKTMSQPAFKDVPIFLCLNKKDLFEQEIKRYPLKDYLPYQGDPSDIQGQLDFISQQFQNSLPSSHTKCTVQILTAAEKSSVVGTFDSIAKRVVDINIDKLAAASNKIRELAPAANATEGGP